MIFTGW